MIIAKASAENAEVRTLIALHLASMKVKSPLEGAFAADLSGYLDPELTLWGARIKKRLAGMIALRRVDNGMGEIQSLRTHPEYLRQGVGSALLDHLIRDARDMDFARLALQTGSSRMFDPAVKLLESRGFISGPAFGNYRKSRSHQFFHLDLH